ncbi:unnamed protein product [Phytomonas sp. Hart1]|nr:unnamed protein product [Phytomonas sp. Hart1]|eukprot:CCW68551.1 unnamed protein product [Phytomonas sp. isolate Hart1]
MSKLQRPTLHDTLPYLRIQLDPKNMVLLRAAENELFLVDMNCAMVSRICQKYLKDENEKNHVGQETETSEECPPNDATFSNHQEIIGTTAYPVIDLSDVASDVLDLSIGFMYNKYKLDVDPEKQLVTQPKWDLPSTAKLIAASVLLEM